MFSDAAVRFCSMVKVLFGLPLRQTTRMVARILSMSGLDGPVPDFSSLSRRQKNIMVRVSNHHASSPLNLQVESAGLMVGEWVVRKHGTATQTPVSAAAHRRESSPPDRFLNPAHTCYGHR